MKSINYRSWFLKALLIIISILYFSFLYIEFFNIEIFISSYMIKYICIMICFLICLFAEKNPLNRLDISLLKVGLFITMFADLFLTVFNYYTLGVALFCVVQILYSIRYEALKISETSSKFIIIFLSLMFIYLIINLFIIKIDILFAVVLFYAICLIISIRKAIKVCKNNLYPYPNKYMIAYGMILFILCDINVALYNVTEVTGISWTFIDIVHNITGLLIWLFYVPSQLLLSLSGYNFLLKKKY
ncbi:hypothetical protein [Clostridium sp.]|nr:hypothetical protein [Clostridium sp.]